MKIKQIRKIARKSNPNKNELKILEKLVSDRCIVPWQLRAHRNNILKNLGVLREIPVWEAGELVVQGHDVFLLQERVDFRDEENSDFIKYDDKWDLPNGLPHDGFHGGGWTTTISASEYYNTVRDLLDSEKAKLDREPEIWKAIPFETAMICKDLGFSEDFEFSYCHPDYYNTLTKSLIEDKKEYKNTPKENILIAPSIKQMERYLRRKNIYINISPGEIRINNIKKKQIIPANFEKEEEAIEFAVIKVLEELWEKKEKEMKY